MKASEFQALPFCTWRKNSCLMICEGKGGGVVTRSRKQHRHLLPIKALNCSRNLSERSWNAPPCVHGWYWALYSDSGKPFPSTAAQFGPHWTQNGAGLSVCSVIGPWPAFKSDPCPTRSEPNQTISPLQVRSIIAPMFSSPHVWFCTFILFFSRTNVTKCDLMMTL